MTSQPAEPDAERRGEGKAAGMEHHHGSDGRQDDHVEHEKSDVDGGGGEKEKVEEKRPEGKPDAEKELDPEAVPEVSVTVQEDEAEAESHGDDGGDAGGSTGQSSAWRVGDSGSGSKGASQPARTATQPESCVFVDVDGKSTKMTSRESRAHLYSTRAQDMPFTERWIKHRKHLFVLTENGKPVLTRYGSTSDCAHIVGVFRTLVASAEVDGEVPVVVESGGVRMVFGCFRSFVVVLVVRGLDEPVWALQLQLKYVYCQLLFMLTGMVHERLEKRPSLDVSNDLHGHDRFFDGMVRALDHDIAHYLVSVQCVSFPYQLRTELTKIIHECHVEDNVYALVVIRSAVVTLVRSKRPGRLHPVDAHLLFNFLHANDNDLDILAPVCLPILSEDAFVNCYTSPIVPGCHLIVTNLSLRGSLKMREMRDKIVAGVEANQPLHDALKRAGRNAYYTMDSLPRMTAPVHFLYKSTRWKQFTAPAVSAVYATRQARKRLFRLYQKAIDMVKNSATVDEAGVEKERKVSNAAMGRLVCVETPRVAHQHVFMRTEKESVLAWVTDEMELYVVFIPLVLKRFAVESAKAIVSWVRSRERELFLVDPLLWNS